MIVAVVGATGTGKSELGLALAERLAARGVRAEIVNGDAMQLYRGMDIGTAKLLPPERRGIPHHLLDVLDVTDEASVARYQRDARLVIEGILARGAVPLLVGGSMLYVAAVLTDFRFPGTDAEIRGRWEALHVERGTTELHLELARRDPAAAAAIGPHNARRIIRALEVIELTGEPFSVGLAARDSPWRPYRQLGLQLERAALTPRLDERVERMWRLGLIDEVRELRDRGLERGATASRAIGYAQALAQLRGDCDEAAAIAETAALTRRYARRQVSWFRRDGTIEWLDALDPELAQRAEEHVLAALVAGDGAEGAP
ncbi:tRNA (adenosine(37)-N6)-dimethylallyltransferase MiaA [Yonghaparkia sp. Soil809]|uniref:tRNA (adenosine(37)-N6)-dimethylallyltransferase MiaA n=1 Tax=Yonghaparkia sp. Soil809 TaxID=1736417 RepID=UPI000A77C236|nr:tRNA (adenosine(37)-N6)-dimethylallyltransferase MiaA [Yonghaparkia sp. Soil809]